MRKQQLIDRITEYLCNGGLFNPEYMNHAEVSKLLMDTRDYLMSNGVMDIDMQWNIKCPRCGIGGVNGLSCPDHNCPTRISC